MHGAQLGVELRGVHGDVEASSRILTGRGATVAVGLVAVVALLATLDHRIAAIGLAVVVGIRARTRWATAVVVHRRRDVGERARRLAGDAGHQRVGRGRNAILATRDAQTIASVDRCIAQLSDLDDAVAAYRRAVGVDVRVRCDRAAGITVDGQHDLSVDARDLASDASLLVDRAAVSVVAVRARAIPTGDSGVA